MFIELVDDLRCPRAHEETWLVAAADRTVDRHIVEGTLGCPVCRAEYPIRGGVASFGAVDRRAPHRGADPAAGPAADGELAMRLAAFLDLTDAQGYALLAGAFARSALILRGLVATHLVVLNAGPGVAAGGGISGLEMLDGIPLADATCRGAALDEAHATPPYLAAAARVLRPRGRLVAPAAAALPAGVAELARDDRLWVAEREAAPPRLVPLEVRATPR